jgi:hypothetical protein
MSKEETIDSLYAPTEAALSDAHSWDAQLFIKLTSGVAVQSKSPSLFGLPVTEQDLFDVGSASHLKGIKYYLDPAEFPFDGDFRTSTGTWPKLSKWLYRCATENGYRLFSNGSTSKDPSVHHLYCTRWSICKRPTSAVRRRIRVSNRATSKDETCRVKITVGVDSSGFFVFGGRSEKRHLHHPKLIMTKAIVPLANPEMEKSEKHNRKARFPKDANTAVQKQQEEQGEVAAALTPLTRELLMSVEKAPYSLQETCAQLRAMIAALNIEDDDGKKDTLIDSMALPTSKKRSKR